MSSCDLTKYSKQAGLTWLKEQFECEYCHDCGGDWYDHDAILLNLGAYGCNWFARCKAADNTKYKVRSRG